MSRMGDAANTGDAASQARNIADKAGEVSQNLRDMGAQARDTAQQKYEQLRDQATDYYQQGKERAQEWEHSLESFIHEKPLQALAIAAGVGVVLGLLWKRS